MTTSPDVPAGFGKPVESDPLAHRSRFDAAAGPGGRPAPTEVALFDPAGRRIRTLVSQAFTAGAQSSSWDGRDDAGRPVASGIYFLRALTGGAETRIKLPVVR